MAGSQRVQEYLQKHKIGNLFEELMAKVISDMPDEPVVYLLQMLERKASRLTGSKAHLRKSMGDLGGVAVAKDRPYTKPWQTNTKRQKNKADGTSKSRTSMEKPDWDNKVKLTAASFDDLWEDGPGTGQKGRKKASPTRASTKSAWADTVDDEEFLFASHGYDGPRRPYSEDDNPLAGEFTLSKDRATKKTKGGPTSSSRRIHGQKADAERHKKELEKLILAKQWQTDSGIEDDRDLNPDDALVLMEDAEDLWKEGVKKIKQDGVRIRPQTSAPAGPDVRVSFCARCAKVMAGGSPSEPAVGTGYGELPDYEYDTDREFYESRPQSAARMSPGVTDEDDEFESVSQVTGPRHPVWQNEDSDDEALRARKGAHMFSPSGVPNRGRPMYSPEHEKERARSKNPLRATIDVYRSIDTDTSERTLKGHSAFNKTWTPGVGHSTDDSSDEEAGSAAVSLKGAGWTVPQTDYDSDASSLPGGRVPGQTQGKTRQYQGQF